jgi:hypothetical protein
MKPVKLLDLMDVLEFDFDEEETWVDLQSGRVIRLEHSLVNAVEEGDEESLEAWEDEEVELAKARLADSGERFVEAPTKFDFHEYRQMERFIGTVEDTQAAEQLWRAIKGKGAFRYFKDTARQLGLLERWYQYREEAMREFVLDWAEAHKVAVLDDTGRKPET